MLENAQPQISAVFLGIASLILLGFFAAWGFLGQRWQAGMSIIPRYEPRRQVPWTGLDLLVIMLFYYFLSIFAVQTSVSLAKKNAGVPKAEQQKQAEKPLVLPNKQEIEKTVVHPLAQLLKDKNPYMLLLCFAVGVVIVPIFEEFFFRLLFTGWLLKAERDCRQKWPDYFKSRGLLAVHLSSAIFAAMHFRSEGPEAEKSSLMISMVMLAAVSLLTTTFTVIWIVSRHGATARDFGWDGQKWKEDLASGALAYFATALPIYFMQIALGLLLPKEFAPDPIALYFFAVILGTLYFRTSRILPSIVMHMLLNAGSLGMAWAMA